MGLCELEISLVYIVYSRIARAMERDPVSKNKRKKDLKKSSRRKPRSREERQLAGRIARICTSPWSWVTCFGHIHKGHTEPL